QSFSLLGCELLGLVRVTLNSERHDHRHSLLLGRGWTASQNHLTAAARRPKIPRMPQVDTVVETTVPPEEVRKALVDFSPQRPELWPGITRSLYEVYSVAETSAEVKEGTKLPLLGSFWARERYDWSDPETVQWTVVESNFCAPGSFVSATLRPREGGGTRVEIHWERTLTSIGGRIAGRMIVAAKGKPVAKSFERALRRLEQA